VPYAGFEEGLHAIPPIGANVWIEFENGNSDYPIWTGCYWEAGQIPLAPELSPEDPALMKVLKSLGCTLSFDDTPVKGGITLTTFDPTVEVPVLLEMNAAGLLISVGPALLSMNAEAGITLAVGETVLKITEANVFIEAPAVQVEAEGNVNVTAVTTALESELNITGAVTAEAEINVTGAVTAEAEVNVAGALTAEGEVNIAGAVTAEGEVNVAGLVSVEGGVNVAGVLACEGDANFALAAQVEGNLAVIGVIEGVVVPPI
jgi:hypothetical protein